MFPGALSSVRYQNTQDEQLYMIQRYMYNQKWEQSGNEIGEYLLKYTAESE